MEAEIKIAFMIYYLIRCQTCTKDLGYSSVKNGNSYCPNCAMKAFAKEIDKR